MCNVGTEHTLNEPIKLRGLMTVWFLLKLVSKDRFYSSYFVSTRSWDIYSSEEDSNCDEGKPVNITTLWFQRIKWI